MGIMTDFVVNEIVDAVVTELIKADLEIDKEEIEAKIKQIEEGIDTAKVALIVTTVKGELCLLFCDKSNVEFKDKPTILNVRSKADEIISKLKQK